MAARAIWKGVLTLDSEQVRVKLYAAVEDRKVHFRLLSRRSGEPIQQRMVDPETGDEVSSDEIRKGFEAEPGVFVVLDEEDLEELEPSASRTIELTRFVPPEEINHQWYERPYWLGPDDGAEEGYFALAAALEKAGREGVARWVMRKKEYVGALRARDGYLLLVSLRHAGEVVSARQLAPPSGKAIAAKEREMAEQLLAAYEDDFAPDAYRDEYRDRVHELIAEKAEGKTTKLGKPRPRKGSGSLTEALEASLAAARGASRG